MLVAKQKQYYQALPDKQQKPNTGSKKTARQKTVNIRKRKALTRVCVALALGIVVISRFAIISEYNYNIRRMERELEELQRVNERLQLQHARVMDINELEDYALHRLGMVYPENRDIVYVAVQGAHGETSVAEETDNERRPGFASDGWFAVLAGKVNNVLNTD